ncbi:MAG: PKD domain-containing protein [Bacteroidetes bacterium]|nr:PKD domain-containing protein [Bacteroidota bacterium]
MCRDHVFMTWGRKNGDASNCVNWPPVCTYAGMDSLLRLRYMMMATNNNAVVTPVGAVWNYIRNTITSIDLYSPDESHPSLHGSYAAACSFYTTLLRKNPELITFNSQISLADADSIKHATRLVAYDSLPQWYVGAYDVQAGFSFSANTNASVSFTNTSLFANSYLWDFGDGDTSTLENPTHQYNATGTYTVTLTASFCKQQHTFSNQIGVINLNLNEAQPNSDLIIQQNGDQITIQASQVIGMVKMLSMVGATVWMTKSGNRKHQFNTGNLAMGIYLIEALVGDHIVQQKIILR